VGAEGEAVDDCYGDPRVFESLAPFREWRVGGDGDEGTYLVLGQDLEEQIGAARFEVDVVELVQAEQVEPAVAGDEARELTVVVGLGEFVDQGGDGRVAHAQATLTGRLAGVTCGAAVAEHRDRPGRIDPGSALERAELDRVNAGRGGQFEAGEAREAREARLTNAAFAAPGVPVFEFGGQRFGQVGTVAELVAQGHFGQLVSLLAHGRREQGRAVESLASVAACSFRWAFIACLPTTGRRTRRGRVRAARIVPAAAGPRTGSDSGGKQCGGPRSRPGRGPPNRPGSGLRAPHARR